MRGVPFVRSADKLALATNATGHLAQSSSASRVTAPHKPGAPAVGQACPCIGLTQPATIIFWTADLSVTRPRLGLFWSRLAPRPSPLTLLGYKQNRSVTAPIKPTPGPVCPPAASRRFDLPPARFSQSLSRILLRALQALGAANRRATSRSSYRSITVLCDRIRDATHRLEDLEPFELRVVEVKRLVLASAPMGKTECFRFSPGFKLSPALPDRM
jgi:hypothetical protein